MSILVIVPISPICRLYSTLLDSTLRLLYLSLLYLTSHDLTLLYKQLAVVVVVLNDRLLPTPTYSHLLPPAPTCSHLYLLPPTLRTVDGNSAWPTARRQPLADARRPALGSSGLVLLGSNGGPEGSQPNPLLGCFVSTFTEFYRFLPTFLRE